MADAPAQGVDFDIDALYLALDRQRQARGMTWAQVSRDINRQFAGSTAAPMAASTLSGVRGRRVLEGDGVLQMLLWLNRTPESFSANTRDEPLPQVPADRILRFDTRKIYALLDAQRATHHLTWAEVSRQIGKTTPSTLTRLANGGRVAFPPIMRVLRWLDRSVASVTRASVS